LLTNPDHELLFSAASLWEIAIKRSLGRGDFQVDPRIPRCGFLDTQQRLNFLHRSTPLPNQTRSRNRRQHAIQLSLTELG